MAYPVYALKCLRGILTRYPKIPTECHVMCSEEHSLQNIALLSLISIKSCEVVKISITQKVTISSRKKCSRKTYYSLSVKKNFPYELLVLFKSWACVCLFATKNISKSIWKTALEDEISTLCSRQTKTINPKMPVS